MPFWIMFVPIIALGRAIATLFVALGQMITGNYFALVPVDGGEAGRVEIVRAGRTDALETIRVTLADGRTFVASFDRRDGPASEFAADGGGAIAVRLVDAGRAYMDCRFQPPSPRENFFGRCTTESGRVFQVCRTLDTKNG